MGYDVHPSTSSHPDNIYETICLDPNASHDHENIYETIEDVRHQQMQLQQPPEIEEPLYLDQPSCSSTYGRIGNAYGRIDIIGHGIGRIERHLSSSCGSINSNHYALESLYDSNSKDSMGRISKVSIQWLLANKWLPLWIANTETGRDYRIIDFLIAQGLERDEEDRDRGESNEKGPEGEQNQSSSSSSQG